ncbi:MULTISPECIES: hypothetical protein [unclassified Moraxella]|uniref:hypothetical protein n=1 Tax=unclassified Moraxella TaxID=2685852 RepID=UPI00359D32F1
MIFLILAICASVLVSVFLKFARQQRLDIIQSILVNYMTAMALCMALLKLSFDGIGNVAFGKVFVFVALGILLPSLFAYQKNQMAWSKFGKWGDIGRS